MGVITVTLKTLREISRNRTTVLMLLLLPVLFFSFFGFIFSSPGSGTIIYNLGVVNQDQGAGIDLAEILPDNIPTGKPFDSMSQVFLGYLEGNFSGSEIDDALFNIVLFDDHESMKSDIELQVLDIGIVLPPDFTDAMVAGYHELNQEPTDFPKNQTEITIYADPSKQSYYTTLSLFDEKLLTFEDMIYGISRLDSPNAGYLDIDVVHLSAKESTDFQYLVAGFLVFNALLQMISVSGYLAKEKETKTIARIKISQLESWQLFAGILVAQLLIFTVQYLVSIPVLIFWNISLVLSQWLQIYFVLIITTVFLTGLSLLVATFVSTADDATTITGIGSAPLGFLSGSFLPVPETYLIGNLQFWDLIPTYHATQAASGIISSDVTIDISRHLLFLVIFSLAILVIGILAFQKRVLEGNIQ